MVKDHLGNEFSSVKAMLEHWNISKTMYYGRIKMGWSLEKTLTTPIYKGRKIKDHNGVEYESIKELANNLGLKPSTVSTRLYNGWNVKDIIELKLHRHRQRQKENSNYGKECYDHLGNKYPNIKTMCETYGITLKIYYGRRYMKWSLEKILTTPKIDHKINGNVSFDHKGVKYTNFKEMCTHYGFDDDIVYRRLKKGWSLEKALTTSNMHKNYIKDHLGNEFSSICQMCKYWNIDSGIVRNRLKSNWSMKNALEILPYKKMDSHLTFIRHLKDNSYKVIFDNKEDIWTRDEIIAYKKNLEKEFA